MAPFGILFAIVFFYAIYSSFFRQVTEGSRHRYGTDRRHSRHDLRTGREEGERAMSNAVETRKDERACRKAERMMEKQREAAERDLPRSMRPSLIAKTITVIVLVVALIYFLFLIYWAIIVSTKTPSQLTSSNGLWFAVGLDQIPDAIAIGVVMGCILTIPQYSIFHALHLTNTMLAIIIPCCVSPFGFFLGRVYAQTSVPNELLEAARIDGAGEARIFFTIVLRLLAPAMVTIFLFLFVGTWNNFLLPLMMVSSDVLKPVTLGLYGMVSLATFNDRGSLMMGALLGVLPVIVLFLGLQRYWQAGLAAGAVKG